MTEQFRTEKDSMGEFQVPINAKYGASTARAVENFPISKIWEDLLKRNELNGFESLNNFYHLTNLETFKKLEDF